MAEERVGRHREMQLVAATLPRRTPDLAHEHPVLRLGRREGREVVATHERSGALLERVRWSGRGHQSARRARSAARERVRAPRTGRSVPSPRSARGSRRARPPRRAPPRRRAARCSAPRRAAPAGGPPSASRLATCPVAWTPASVRPATARSLQRRQHGVERLAQHALDRPLAGLPRPAPEPGPVVLERQPERRHATSAHVTGRLDVEHETVDRSDDDLVARRERPRRPTRLPDLAVELHLPARRQRADDDGRPARRASRRRPWRAGASTSARRTPSRPRRSPQRRRPRRCPTARAGP